MTPHQRRDMRADILDAARKLFGTKGYTVTSIADLAEALSVTKGALYYHFKSKEAILSALVAEPAAEIAVIADDAAGRPPRELLGALIDLQAQHPAAYMALQSGDVSVLQEHSQRHDFAGKTELIIMAVAGPHPSPIHLIRARMAVAAVKEGTMAALVAGHGKLTDQTRLDLLEAAMATLGAGGEP
ncbi:TetR/AcrR family transcriptional regulator [Streptomyces sp. NBC_01498]|uniref:TetR/AcrR family transcriptional regulator n=1 Tax=Streptomyces sp. NBC_01498 TaxID=2975870 RepID=UPI002E7BC8AC|nr:helix-turn-helix domain-containing protein [Streptomyces sp. NBC_01498]WTL27037.1 TetR/AcrR family transcriptional regulator [Streptomyces sp. NBC_01498]